jgi:hypothetical protein
MVGEIRDRETAQIGMLGELVLGRSLNKGLRQPLGLKGCRL